MQKNGEGVGIRDRGTLGRPVKISKLNIISHSKYLKEYLQNVLGGFENNVLDLQQIKNEVEKARKAFVQFGYYLTDIDLRVKYVGKYNALLFVEVKNPLYYTFFFEKAAPFEVSELKLFLSETMLSYKRELGEDGMIQVLTEYAQNLGYGGVVIEVTKSDKVNTKGEEGVYYFISVKVDEKLKLEKSTLRGIATFRMRIFANSSIKMDLIKFKPLSMTRNIINCS